MTSQQVMLNAAQPASAPTPAHRAQRLLRLLILGLAAASLAACATDDGTLVNPSPTRQVWAVAPLRNQSGTSHADGVRQADHVARQLARVRGLEVLPVNRTLAAMQQLSLESIDSRDDALSLRQAMGVDALVVGAITAYDPYHPPKLGLTLELYADPRPGQPSATIDPRRLTRAATDGNVNPNAGPPEIRRDSQPVVSIAGFYDGRAQPVVDRIQRYAKIHGEGQTNPHAYRHYLLSIDLFSEFAAHEVGERLILAETLRLAPPPVVQTNAANAQRPPS